MRVRNIFVFSDMEKMLEREMDKTPTVSVAASAAAVKEASLVSSELMAPTIPLLQWT